MNRIVLFLIALPILLSSEVFGQERNVQDFQVMEPLIKNNKLAIIATDDAGTPLEEISGTFQFVINGFKYDLNFAEGVAIAPQPVEKSTFVFIKHINQLGSNGKLFFVYKNNSGINPIFIPWYYLIIVPLLIILIGYLFKRLLILAIILLVGLFIFNYSRGLDISTLFDTVVHGIRNLTGT